MLCKDRNTPQVIACNAWGQIEYNGICEYALMKLLISKMIFHDILVQNKVYSNSGSLYLKK